MTTCKGCGRRRARRRYCNTCLNRLAHNLPLDLDEYITQAESRRLRAVMWKLLPFRLLVLPP